MTGSGLRARGLSKRFGDVIALEGVDLDIPAGTIASVVGPNGAGKTTLLRIFATLLHPDAGRAWVDGCDVVADARGARARIGVALANDRSLYWRLTGIQNLRFSAGMAGMARKRADEASRALAVELGIEPLLARRISTYSTGQRQRLMLARALLGGPSVLLLDEPMRGLDTDGSARVRAALRAAAGRGATVLVATPAGAEDEIADRRLELGAGAIVERPAVRL